MKLLKDILYKVSIQSVVGNTNVGINKIEFDSNKINKGDLFVAIRGTKNDGNKYISHAISNGASVIICETLPENTNKELTYIIVSDSRKALALISSNYYKNPSKKLKLIGVTGTNGKTSITSLLFDLFKKLNKKVGLLSTNVILINDKKITAKQTTPDPLLINQLLNQMVDAEVEYCFMEVSSHAILQSRIYGLEFNIGVFSNLTHDHLDYHKTFDAYRDVKKIFFDSLNKGSYSLTNIDDKNGSYMIQNTKSKSFSYSINSTSDFSLRILEKDFDGMKILINSIEFWTKLIGKFNAYNLLAVYSVSKILNFSDEVILKNLSSLNCVDGRFEIIKSNLKKIGIVDYAHSPDSLKNVLTTINDIKKSKNILVTVIGCGGDRDKTKRPIMGKIATTLSDKVIFTSDNPRNEDPLEIVNQMLEGVSKKNMRKVETELNRKKAIQKACSSSNDIILVAGKGHEKYQIEGNKKKEFDDKKILIKSLKTIN